MAQGATQRMPERALVLVLAAVIATLGVASPLALAAFAAAAVAIVLLARPTYVLIAFAISASTAEWFYEAHQAGALPVPSAATAIATWSIGLLGLMLLAANRHRVLVRETLYKRIVRVVLWYAVATAISVVVATIRLGSGQIWEGTKGVLVAVAPIGVMSLLSFCRSKWAGLRLLVAVAIGLSVYGFLQWTSLSYGVGEGWFTFGQATRWWSTSAVFGTFANTGNHPFGNSLVMLLAVLLPWAVAKADLSRRLLLVVRITCAGLAIMVLLSLARAALLSLVVVCIVVVFSRRGAKLATFAPLVAAVILSTGVATSALSLIQSRGIVDQSVDVRLAIWSAMEHQPSPRWILGEGYDTVGLATNELGVAVQGPQASQLGPTTDNYYLRRLIEQGLLGIATFVALILVLLRESFSASFSSDGKAWRLGLRALATAVAVQSITSDTLFFQTTAALFALCLGAIGAGLVRERRDARSMTTASREATASMARA